MWENVNCTLIVSPLNDTLYYVLPHRKFPEAFAPKVLNIDIKRSLQKSMRQLPVSLFMDKL